MVDEELSDDCHELDASPFVGTRAAQSCRASSAPPRGVRDDETRRDDDLNAEPTCITEVMSEKTPTKTLLDRDDGCDLALRDVEDALEGVRSLIRRDLEGVAECIDIQEDETEDADLHRVDWSAG